MRITIPNTYFFLLIFTALFSTYAGNAQKIWDGGAGTDNWGDDGNWAPDGTPAANQDVTIGTFTVNVNVAANAKSITLTAGCVLNINNDVTIKDGGFIIINSNASVVFNSTAQFKGGSSGNGNGVALTVQSNSFLSTAHPLGFNTSGSAQNVVLQGSFNINTAETGSTYQPGINYLYTGATAQVTGDAVSSAKSLTIDNSAGVTLSNPSVTVTGQISGAGNLMVPANGLLKASGTVDITSLTANANNCTVEYNGNEQVLKQTAYHHLSLSGSGSKNMNGVSSILGNFTLAGSSNAVTTNNMSVTGDVTIGDGTTLDAAHVVITVGGSWTNNGSFTSAGSTVIFNNTTTLQTITGATTFNNLTLNKEGQTLTIRDSITINGMLTFTKGVIDSDPANSKLVIFTATGNHKGASVATKAEPYGAFISGPVRKELIANDYTGFTFPVGKATPEKRLYVRFSIGIEKGAGTFTGEYFPVSAHKLGPIDTPGIKQISNCEYWTLSRDAGTATPDVSLFWTNTNACSGPNYISDAKNIVVAQFNTNNTGGWDNYGGGGDYDPITQSGSVSVAAIDKFGPLTFGTLSLSNALPIVFANITATQREGDVVVAFSNLTEEKVASYQVERSADGLNFKAIGTLEPKLNNNSRADYTYMDHAPYNGDNYYRIRGVETTGKVIYSAVVHLQAIGKAAGLLIYPNPARTNSLLSVQMGELPAGKYLLRVFGQHGQLMHTAQFSHSGGAVSTPLPTSGLSAGRYMLELNGAIKRTKSFLLQ